MSDSWHSYPKVYALGHRAIKELCDDPVIVEEKVDGSQISFGIFNGEIKIKSRRKDQSNPPDKMFELASEKIHEISDKLTDGWTYRGEYLSKPKHNTLCYGRTPINNIVIFDINDSHESYLDREAKEKECEKIGLEVVPCLINNVLIENSESLISILETDSFLGGVKIEGLVIKNYSRFSEDGKAMMGKYVSEAFKEVHQKDWKKRFSSKTDYIKLLQEEYRSEPRWEKAIQHLKDSSSLENDPKDIGPLIKEIISDIRIECEEEIKQKLFDWLWRDIQRGVTRGFPEWYKEKLLNRQFES